MKKLAEFIVKRRFIVLGIFVVILTLSAVGAFFVNINSDMMSYLPDDMETGMGLDFMRETFDMQGDAMVAVDGITKQQAANFASEIAKIEGVKEGGVIWIGMFEEAAESLASLGDLATDIFDKIKNNPDIIKMFAPRENCYMFMLQFNVPTGSTSAMTVLNTAEKLLEGEQYAIGGSSYIVKKLYDTVLSEILWYMLIGVGVVLLILFLTTSSYLEPLILLLTLGISIILNMGTNLLLPEVSVITFAASAILQLGLSMDYAIFLMHAYYKEKEKTLDPKEALLQAIPKTLNTVTASALTTIGGFLALFFMKFELGADLGIVLAKGVLLSLLTVIFLQPCLILLLQKPLKKTSHRVYSLKFNGVAGFSVSKRIIIVGLALAIFVPALIGQYKVSYSYMKMEAENPAPNQTEQLIDKMGNTLIVMVPLATPDDHYKFIKDIKSVEGVEAVNGLYAMLPQEYGDLVPTLLRFQEVAGALKGYVNNDYTIYSLLVDVDEESAEGTAMLKHIREVADKYFDGKIYTTGQTQAVQDLSAITPTDFTVVSLISMLLIFCILMISTRSFKLPFMLVAVIELGIFINLSLCYLFRQQINFMAYIIISSVQLGATVDYAILYCSKFKEHNKTLCSKEAAYLALTDTGTSIMTSAAIIAGACLSVFFVTKNLIIGQITMLIARGAAISCLLVMVLLPALMAMFGGKHRLDFSDKASLKLQSKWNARALQKSKRKQEKSVKTQDMP